MTGPLNITLPHTLGREEAARRMRDRVGELPDHIPGGLAKVDHRWLAPDRMALDVAALGAQIATVVQVTDTAVVLTVSLPPLLQPFRGAIEAAVTKRGGALLLGSPEVAGSGPDHTA